MGSRTCARALLERTVRAASCFNNVGALFLVVPLAASLMLHSLPPFELLYSSEGLHSQQPFLLTPACIFVICMLLLVAITIRSHPHKNCSSVPAHLLHLPFNPVHVATFTSTPCSELQARPAVQATSRQLMARSSSHPCLARHADEMQQASSPMPRSPSPSAFLIGARPLRSAQSNSQDAAPAVPTRRVARTSSQPSLARLAEEMQAADSPVRRSPSHNTFLTGAKPFRSAQSNDQLDKTSAVLTRKVERSSSQPCLAILADEMQKGKSPMRRSPSHNTFLTGAKPAHAVATENLSDEEANRRFSAFIESRFAAMKRQMVE